MKKVLVFLTMLSLVFVTSTFAQSVKVVPAVHEDGTAYVNSLIKEMIDDTLADGSQAHDIYVLKKGAVYLLSQKMIFHNPMTIVGETPTADSAIAQITPQPFQNGTCIGQVINTYADLTIKNVYFHGVATNNTARVGGSLIVAKKPKLRIHLDGVGWDYMGWSSLQFNQDSLVVILENLHVRNNTRPSGVYCPWTMNFGQHNTDTLIVRNCTIFNQLSFLFKGRWMYFNYLEIDHNTICQTGKWPLHYHWYRNAKITNNIFYDVDMWGDKVVERQGQDPDLEMFGIVNVDTLPGNAPGDTVKSVYTIPENQRKLLVKNNCYYWSQDVLNYYDTQDSVQCDVWMNPRTKAMFADDEHYPGLVEENTFNIDPGFVQTGPNVILDWVKNARAGGTAYLPGWEPDKDNLPDYYRFVLDWPYPEDLSYSTTSPLYTAADGGFPVGDLNWFPEKKKEWEQWIQTDVKTEFAGKIPSEFSLDQNYPNPFNPVTSIHYTLPKSGQVSLVVYNEMGQQVKTLINKKQAAGTYVVSWQGTNDLGMAVPSGIYFYRLKTQSGTQVRKMLLLK
ncbi:MAG: T9SS type A sorting domain-containing protein [Calditrichaeota bacterium]|nr:T9SS type A sorting domain-containing protein [Calditrichota bacterium]